MTYDHASIRLEQDDPERRIRKLRNEEDHGCSCRSFHYRRDIEEIRRHPDADHQWKWDSTWAELDNVVPRHERIVHPEKIFCAEKEKLAVHHKTDPVFTRWRGSLAWDSDQHWLIDTRNQSDDSHSWKIHSKYLRQYSIRRAVSECRVLAVVVSITSPGSLSSTDCNNYHPCHATERSEVKQRWQLLEADR